MKIAVCDSRIPISAMKMLYGYCDRIILLPLFSALAEPVSAHPDMLVFPCEDEKIIFTHGAYLDECCKVFDGTGYEVFPIVERASEKYPHDILLNAARIGNYIFGRKACVSSSVVYYAEKSGIKFVDVNQGYAKCSICTVTENAIISSDPSILKATSDLKLDILEISKGGVGLHGYDGGFIGGASGCDGENVFFCGDIKRHPDGEKIIEFCNLHGRNVVSLSRDALYDVGTIFFL